MSITINFGSSPEEIHSVGDLGGDIWDIIFTWKEIAEEQELIQPIVDKFKKISRRVLGIQGIGNVCNEYYQKEYCRENKIPQSYNGKEWGSDDDVMVVAIVFQQFHRKLPSARKLPDQWKKRGLQLKIVKHFWEQEDQNMFLIAKSFTEGYYRREEEVGPFLEHWARKGIEYTGCPQFIQMGLDRRAEYYSRPEYAAAARER